MLNGGRVHFGGIVIVELNRERVHFESTRVHLGPLVCHSYGGDKSASNPLESTWVHFVGNLIRKLSWNHFEPIYDSLQLSGLKLFWPCLSLLATMVKKPQREECVRSIANITRSNNVLGIRWLNGPLTEKMSFISAINTENRISTEFLACQSLTG